jgi:hypothetical protein
MKNALWCIVGRLWASNNPFRPKRHVTYNQMDGCTSSLSLCPTIDNSGWDAVKESVAFSKARSKPETQRGSRNGEEKNRKLYREIVAQV